MMTNRERLKRKKQTNEQTAFLKEAKEKREKAIKEEAKKEWLSQHRLIKIKTVKQAEKLLKELNDKCDGCSRLLNSDERKLRIKLQAMTSDVIRTIKIK